MEIENRKQREASGEQVCIENRCFAERRRAGEKRKVRGSSDCGTDSISYKDTAAHCGILTFRVVSLKVFDYLFLFSGKLEDEMKVVVFPRRYEMKIEADLVSDGNAEQNQRISFLPGFNYEDIRQIREYRDGDSIRHIHWNQTARSDQLWVKEYEEEINGPVRLFLLYQVLAVVPGPDQMHVNGENPEAGVQESVPQGMMRLTGDLSWYAQDRLIFRFSEEKLEEELAQRTFMI